MVTVAISPKRAAGLPSFKPRGLRAADWHGVAIGDQVYDLADPRHCGVIVRIEHSTALVRWDDSGWFSWLSVLELRKAGR